MPDEPRKPGEPVPYVFGGYCAEAESVDTADPWRRIKKALASAPTDTPWCKFKFRSEDDCRIATQRLRWVSKKFGPRMMFSPRGEVLFIRLNPKKGSPDASLRPESR